MLLAYWWGIHETRRRRQVACFAAMWAALGMGILIKGPAVVPLFVIVLVAMAIATPQGRRIGLMLPIAGPAIALAIAVPWYLGMALADPKAIDVWLFHSVGRFRGEIAGRGDWHYYLVRAPLFWLPWPVAVAAGLYAAFKRQAITGKALAFSLIWFLGGLAYLSASGSKFTHYALVLAPPMMALAGVGLDWLVFRAPLRLGRWGLVFLVAHWAAPVAAIVAAGVFARRFPDFALPMLSIAATAAVAMGSALWLYARARRTAALLLLALMLLVVLPWIEWRIFIPVTNQTNESALAGQYVAQHVPLGQGAAMYRARPIDGPAIFYAKRSWTLLDSPEQLREWLVRHPRGCVLLRRKPFLPEVEPLGGWLELPIHPAAFAEFRKLCLLQAVPAAPAACHRLESCPAMCDNPPNCLACRAEADDEEKEDPRPGAQDEDPAGR
jgi:4-amino-4-deoxy-L-arabinose transferase-like glycosyltransferase